MKKFRMALLAGISALALGACSAVPSGHVGVKVKLYGSDKGVDTEELTPGRYWIGPMEELYLFPTFTQNYCWTDGDDEACGSPKGHDEAIPFQTIEGMTVRANVGISYTIDPEKADTLFQKYRKGIEEITDIYLRNMVRDAIVTHASSRTVEDVYGKGKVQIMEEVLKTVRAKVQDLGILIENIYWIGEIQLPPSVVESLNAKIQATQMAQQRQNEVAQARAEADKKIEEARGQAESILTVAKAQAEANRILAQSLTRELVDYKAVEKWNGELPRLTGNAVPFISVTTDEKK